ncbi:MAG: cysteine--tRNA ligase [Marinilabiliaceae bacterium]|jgi:cysteinyl-tRNA synthetase|nr:cysteine--tRNA ligase [Marinilabiliaceae bacterium]
MEHPLHIYNSLSSAKEQFIPINPPQVGIYVCGPTVYSDSHLGHARPNITFDVLIRYLKALGYRVTYVRNITDVGHLEDEALGEGEDRIAKKARQEKIDPMQVVKKYTDSFHNNMKLLNVNEPDIEPRATAHIKEQLELIETILERGFAYKSNDSIYFNVRKYNEDYNYGILSGRKLEDLVSNTRELKGQVEKRYSADFALWKKAEPKHIMRWHSPWGEGFPGWHLECSAMGARYLGKRFDIHGGGMDLKFPHHECEIAQSTAANGEQPVNYWMHNNMITINGQKMARSLNNFITLSELFNGTHEVLEQAYSPMTIRFFILQAHYRGTLDFSNEALQAASKGINRLMKALETLEEIKPSEKSTFDVPAIKSSCFAALNDDLNTPVLLAHLFEGVKLINSVNDGKEAISPGDLDELKSMYRLFVNDVLGFIKEESEVSGGIGDDEVEKMMAARQEAKLAKDWARADEIREQLSSLGIIIKDTRDGSAWERK